MFCYQLGINLWVGAILVAGRSALAIGFINGYLVMRTGIPSFLITLGTFFVLQGANLGVTKLVTGSVSSPNINQMDGFASLKAVFAHDVPASAASRSTSPCIWWLAVRGAVAPGCCTRTRVGNWIYAVGGNAAPPARSVSR